MFSKKGVLFLIVVLLAILMVGCTPGGNDPVDSNESEFAATVNNVGISTGDFENAVERMVLLYEQQGFDFEGEEGTAVLEQIRQQVINGLVQQEVLLQNAKEKGYEVSEEMIETKLEEIKIQFPTDQEFQDALEQNQLTEDELKSMIIEELQIEQVIKNEMSEITVTDEEILQTYDQYKVQFEAQTEGMEETHEFPSFEEVKAEVEMEVRQKREQEQFGQVMEELKADSDIEIFI